MLEFTGERIVPGAKNCEPLFALKMYQEHMARYLFAAQICEGQSVLDVGCGVGYGTQMLAISGASQVIGFDISKEAIDHANLVYRHPSVEFLVASAERFKFDRQFDVVTCFELIEHVHRQHDVIQNLSDSLKTDGCLVISTPRTLYEKRSAYHTREMSVLEFEQLLRCYFKEIHLFFENNHFVSLISNQQPHLINKIHALEPQFNLGQADYCVAVASQTPIDLQRFQSVLVLNNDAYVKNLERDVNILHRAEDDLKLRMEQSSADIHKLREQVVYWTGAAQKLEGQLEQCAEAKRPLEQEREQRVEAAQREIHQLREQTEALRLEAEAAQREIQQLREQTEALRLGIDTRQAEIEKLRSESGALVSDLRKSKGNVEKTEAASEFLRAELENARKNNDHLSTCLLQTTKELDEWKRRLVEIEGWSSSLRQDVTIWQQRANDEATLKASLQTQIQDLRNSKSWKVTAPLRRALDIGLSLKTVLNGRSSRSSLAVSPQGASATTTPPVVNGTVSSAVQEIAATPRYDSRFEASAQYDVIYVIGCHEGESKRYRAYNLAEGLNKAGYKALVIGDNQLAELTASEFDCHTVILFRCAWDSRVEQIVDYCRRRKIPVAFDVDDLVFDEDLIPFVRVVSTFTGPAYEEYLNGVRRYRKTLEEADFATCTTTFLAKRIEQAGKKAAVIPNSLNYGQIRAAENLHKSSRDSSVVRLGYFSGSNTHQVDFEACAQALQAILSKYPQCRFVLVGILDLDASWEPFADRIERVPLLPHIEMLEQMGRIDINLAPLEVGNPYCESKSQLKIFEAGLVGMPTVASAISSYQEAVEPGVDGFLASSTEEWFESIEALVTSAELRREMGERARARAVAQFGIDQVASVAARVYGLPERHKNSNSLDATVHSDGRQQLKITWIVPGLIIGGGGHRNILRAAYHLQRFGHSLELYFTNTELTEEQLADAVNEHFYPLKCPMHRYQGSIAPTDVLFATHWTTVDAALRAKDVAKEIMYFVQDFEPAFAPMGTEYILAENTYRQGLYHITSGPWCEVVLKRDFGCDADHFLLPVDRNVYFPRSRTKSNPHLLFFAKPEMPRRCFELGIMALQEVHQRKPHVEMILFGSKKVEETHLPFPASVRSLVPTIQDLAEMYSNADLGIVFSTTNPSLVPYEMMACGLPVVDLGRPGNEINYGGRKDITLLVDPNPSIMAEQICHLLDDKAERGRRSTNGIEFVKGFPSEEQMARRVEFLILRRFALRSQKATAAAVGA